MSTLQTTNLKNPSSGSNNIVLATDGSTTITTLNGTTITGTSVRGVITSGTAVASTSGTAIDFTGIPSWVKRVTLLFAGVSTNSTGNYLIQVGSGSVITTGYLTAQSNFFNSTNGANSTTGFLIEAANSANTTIHGSIRFELLSGNTYVGNGAAFHSNDIRTSIFGGSVALSGALDRVRFTTVSGTATFDAGSINILYEG